ncbi:MAG: DUF4446 family protein [Lachnospiraceae bacterium]|nr:DUF4446 family protein [Lachnospiraceae bacterium]
MSLFDSIGLDESYVVLGLVAFQVILFIMLIVLLVKNSKWKKKYQAFMEGSDGKTLEDSIRNRFEEINQLKERMESSEKNIEKNTETLLGTFQKTGIVKYDAFKEMGGKLSFSLCVLNDHNDGFLLTSMHSSREGCYTYVKEIIKGESFVLLSEEEKQALSEAVNKKNFMQ